MEKIRNLSLKKTILLYFVISLTAAFLLSGFTVHFARNMQNKIWEKYIDYADYTDVFQQYGKKYEIEISRPNQSQMNRLDYHLSEMCDFMEIYSVLIFSIVGSVVAVFFFYKNKLKTPLQELKDASQMIADNELDFHVSYENKDEMGTLCKEFEMMRSDLADNNRKMWRMIDDEKALRNAIAHDIRSPLSILRGYQEMLLEFVSAESIKTEDVIDILQTGMYQIDRIEHFTENMRKMSHLEQRELQCSEIELSELAKKIEAEAAMLSKKESKLCKVERVQEQNIVKVDEELVMEVTDNRNHYIPNNYQVELTELSNGKKVDSRIYPELQQMFNDARAEGLALFVREGYRTTEEQQKIMDEKINEYEKQGYSAKEAKKRAEKYVAIPDTSEHQLGLSVDINADTDKCSSEKVYQWLDENAYKYGFVKRYPEDKTDITGISNEPWHYRYVGTTVAKIMKEENLCLEEYLEKYK